MLLVPRVSLECLDGDREKEWSTNNLRRIAQGKIVVLRNQSPFPDSPLIYNLKGGKSQEVTFLCQSWCYEFFAFFDVCDWSSLLFLVCREPQKVEYISVLLIFRQPQGLIQRRTNTITRPEDVAFLERFVYKPPAEVTNIYGTVGTIYIFFNKVKLFNSSPWARYFIFLKEAFCQIVWLSHVYKTPVLKLGLSFLQ